MGAARLSTSQLLTRIDSSSTIIFLLRLVFIREEPPGNNYTGFGMDAPNGYLSFISGGNNNLMVITPSGNVGIGTSVPSAVLDVATSTSGQSAIIVPRDTTANRPPAGVNRMIRFNSTTNKFEAYQGLRQDLISSGGSSQWNNGASSSINYMAGNVGIGTTTSGQKLSVAGTIETQGGIYFNQGASAVSNNSYLGSTSAGAVDAQMGFYAAGVGSSNASHGPYFVQRGIYFQRSLISEGISHYIAGNPTSPGANEGSINFWTGNEQPRMITTGSGDVGIGTASPKAPCTWEGI